MNSVILEYKAKGAKTSEELFGIDKQPADNSPLIDGYVSFLKRDIKDIVYQLKHLDIEQVQDSDIRSISSDVDNMDTYIDNFETLRGSCEELRSWGEQWKNFAKEMFELLPKDKQEMFIQSEFLND